LPVVIADDDPRVRIALTALLEHHRRFVVVGAVGSGDAAARLCSELRPALAVVDVMMPSGGEVAIRAIRAASARTLVVVLTARSDRRTRERMISAGALGVVVKGSSEPLTDVLLALWHRRPTGAAGPSSM
jgi:DNA-binding NarL/FixJ family response regulator